MKRKQNFKLIDGTFTPPEACQVIFDLINSKINYHTRENFSNKERFGEDLPHSEMRIKSLRELHISLKKIFELAEKKGLNLKIDGEIEITIIE